MNDDERAQVFILLRLLRRSEEKLAGLRNDTRATPFGDAATRAFEVDIAGMKAELFDLSRAVIEAEASR